MESFTFTSKGNDYVSKLKRENDRLQSEVIQLKKELFTQKKLNEELINTHRIKNTMVKDFTKANFTLKNANETLNKEKDRLNTVVKDFQKKVVNTKTQALQRQSGFNKPNVKGFIKSQFKRNSRRGSNFMDRLSVNFNNASKNNNMRMSDLINGQLSVLAYEKTSVARILQSEKFNFVKDIFKNYQNFKDSFDNFDDFEMDDTFYLLKSIVNDFVYFLDLFARLNRVIKSHYFFSKQIVLSESFRDICVQISKILQCERATFYMVDKGRNELWSRAAGGSNQTFRMPLGTGIAGSVAITGIPTVVDDVYNDSRFDPSFDTKTGFKTNSILVWPIVEQSTKQVVAVFQAINKTGTDSKSFDLNDKVLAEVLAEMLGNQIKASLDFSDFSSHEFKLKKLLSVFP